ncbi:hypothetical protein BTZ20_3992 [Rhodococcus sp. MTM3W5.2]|nr:hypothetical protein BTZ20_3992 [Rhodococcus sp. MTM3W5.2]
MAYDKTPPYGGPHDATWATCTGIVYPNAIRTENAVHSLEHGAVWIAYNPDKVSDDQRDALADRVDGKSYMLMSPYPGLDSPSPCRAGDTSSSWTTRATRGSASSSPRCA